MIGKGLESLIPQKAKTNAPAPDPVSHLEPHSHAIPQHALPPQNKFRSEPPRNFHPPARASQEAIFQIEVDRILPNPFQPRREFVPQELEELAQSIREFGVIQPLVVSKQIKETEHGTEVEYTLIAGERRLRASKLAGLERVPVIVKNIQDARVKLELALIENVQRSDLSPLESARAYARLQDEFGITQREIAARVGKSRETIANTLRLLNLPKDIQDALSKGLIHESQARMLLGIEDPTRQRELLDQIIRKKTTVRELKEKISTENAPHQGAEERFLERELEEKIGVPVKVLKEGGKGKVMLHFYSEDEYQRIIKNLIGLQ